MGKYTYILVNPPKMKNYIKRLNDVCLGLGYIHAFAKQKYEGIILNSYLNDLDSEETAQIIIEENPKVVGISCNYYSSIPGTVMLVENLRNRGYKGHISLGGHGAVTSRETLLKYLDIDSLAIGDGEKSFFQLVDTIENENFNYNVNGFYYKKGESIIEDYAKPFLIDIDKLPFPTRPGDEGYPVENEQLKTIDFRTFNISTSRGCTYNCTYCDMSVFYQKQRRVRSVNDLVNEIEYIINKYNVHRFSFSDDNFIGGSLEGRKRALEFCNALKEKRLQIKFAMEARVSDMTPDLLIPLMEAGLHHVNLGVESGNQRMLNTWKKGITVSQSEKAINVVQSLGLSYNVNFILYDMYSTLEELWDNYNFLVRTRSVEFSEKFFSIFNNPLGVLNGTPIANSLLKENLQKDYVMRQATEEEQEILNKYRPIWGYDAIDSKMNCFIKNQNYWIENISNIAEYYENSSEFDKGIRLLCLQLFKQSLMNAEKECEDYEVLQNIIDKFIKIKNPQIKEKMVL